MASINYATREISCKIVYYGPGLSGKTTNLQIIHKKVPDKDKSEMVSLATETDRTLFFDFLPLDLGSIKGFSTKFQLYTVPGQVYYNATRKLVLRGVDGVVFVADSQASKRDENVESFQNLEENLREYGYSHESIPFVLQYNKRDLPGVMTLDELNALLNKYNLAYYEAIASTGVGVFTTLKAIGKAVIDKFNAKYSGNMGMRRARPRPQQPAAPAAVPQRPAAASPRPAPAPQQPPQPGFPAGPGGFPAQGGAPFRPAQAPQAPQAPQQPAQRPPANFGREPQHAPPTNAFPQSEGFVPPIQRNQQPPHNPGGFAPPPGLESRPSGVPSGQGRDPSFNNAPIHGGKPELAPLTPMGPQNQSPPRDPNVPSSPFLQQFGQGDFSRPQQPGQQGFKPQPPPNLESGGGSPFLSNRAPGQAPQPNQGQPPPRPLGPSPFQGGDASGMGLQPGQGNVSFPTKKLPEGEEDPQNKGFWGNLFGRQK